MPSGDKYLRILPPVPIAAVDPLPRYDVYSVIEGFDVRCPARQHALKKILCAGLRGKGDEGQDIQEAIDALQRALHLLDFREMRRVDG